MDNTQRFDVRVMINQTSTRNLKILYNKIQDDYIRGAINCELIQRQMDKINAEIKAKQIAKLDQIFGCCEQEGEVE